MIILTDIQRAQLIKYIPNFDENGEVNDLLLALDDVMLDSLDENDERTDETIIIAKLYDQIYTQN